MMPPLVTEKITHSQADGWDRLTARVAKKELWIELAGGRLQADPATWASFSLLAAMEQGADILLQDCAPPDVVWQNHLKALVTIFQRWWGGQYCGQPST